VLQSLLPTSFPAMNLAVVQPVNQRLRALATTLPTSGYTNYLDLYPAFVDSAGRQDRRLFNDGVHPSEAGYRVWRDRLVPFLAKVRKKNR
jgi:lysophospholipase L1-like esterase